jgi:hypothetical protein
VESKPPNPPGWDKPVPFSAVDTAVREAPAQGHSPRQTCPFCREQIHAEARKCPYCQEYLDPALAAEREPLKPLSGAASASFWLGLLSPLFFGLTAPLAVLLGLGALLSPSRRKTRGTGMAIVGLLLGLLWTGALVLFALKARELVPPSEQLPLF